MCAAAPKAESDPKGLKRICPNCGTRYFDLSKRPIICPNCTTEFKSEPKTKGRRGRLPVAAVEDKRGADAIPGDDEATDAVVDDETVSLEEVEEDDAAEADEDIDAIDPDLDIADEDHEGTVDDEDEDDAVVEDLGEDE